jgi:hypothetical protein
VVGVRCCLDTNPVQFLRHIRICFLSCYISLATYTGVMATDSDEYWPGKKFGLPSGWTQVDTDISYVVLPALAIDWAIAVGISVICSLTTTGSATLLAIFVVALRCWGDS